MRKDGTAIRIDPGDISGLPGAFWAEKLPIPSHAELATASGNMESREGRVSFIKGDAILTGVEGEKWPVPREKFLQTYRVNPPTISGQSGEYIKLPKRVICLKVDCPLEIPLTDGRGTLNAVLGDYLVQYQPGDLAVVSESIFLNSYRKLAE